MKNNKNGGNVRTVDPKKYLAERRRNKAYWGKRAKQRNTRMIDEAEATARELKKGYAAAETLIEQEVRNIYRGFENAFSLSHAEAKRLIDTAKSETPSKALLDSINRIADPDKRREMQALVSAPAYKWRIDRLDKIQKQAKELSARLYNAELRTDLRFLAAQMDEAYKHTIFDIQQGTGGSGAFEVLPESRIKQVLNTKWRGEHFSRRIWGNTQNLVTELRQNMLESFMTGESEQDAAARIQERFGVAEFEARRLIRTESTYVCGQAELEGYRNSAVERYEFASLDDDRRSKICERLDGKTFPISKAKPGINYPPMHPFCRSSTLPVLPDEEDLDKEWDDFIAEYVPEDLTFEEWLDGLEPAGDGKLEFKLKKEDSAFSWTNLPDNAVERVRILDKLITDEIKKASSFNGKVVINDNTRYLGTANYDGSITLNSKSSRKTEIHELLHQHSEGGDNRVFVSIFKNIEEGTVELLAQEICKAKGIPIGKFEYSYVTYVDALRQIKELSEQYVSDYDFALEIFRVPLDKRAAFLKDMMKSIPKSNVKDFKKALKILGVK